MNDLILMKLRQDLKNLADATNILFDLEGETDGIKEDIKLAMNNLDSAKAHTFHQISKRIEKIGQR